MTGLDQPSITITARTGDGYDAIVRLLVDSQRFGFVLLDVALTTTEGQDASIRITVLADSTADCCSICSRLARHPALSDVRVLESCGAPCHAASTAAPLRSLEARELVVDGVAS